MSDDILRFWFDEVSKDGWFKPSDQTDQAIRERFGDRWETERANPPEHFLGDPQSALAAVILFDQFPRNMHRGHADAFATDPIALAVAKGAVARAYDHLLNDDERSMLYMPFMHSEDIDDQERSLALFTALGDKEPLDFARQHHDVIARFGRFPQRNPALRRADRAGEADARGATVW